MRNQNQNQNHNQKTNNKIAALLEMEGFDDLNEALGEFRYSSLIPGICMNDDCSYTNNYEMDQAQGWCDECETASVKSLALLAGLC